MFQKTLYVLTVNTILFKLPLHAFLNVNQPVPSKTGKQHNLCNRYSFNPVDGVTELEMAIQIVEQLQPILYAFTQMTSVFVEHKRCVYPLNKVYNVFSRRFYFSYLESVVAEVKGGKLEGLEQQVFFEFCR